MTSSIFHEKEKEEWLVQVFRRTMTRGWEMCRFSDGSSSADNIITAAPKKGCVEMKKLRIRIHLFHQPQKNNKGGSKQSTEKSPSTNQNSSPKPGAEKSPNPQNYTNNNTVVVRRMDTLLLGTRRGGAVVLKFQNRGECFAFSDKLISLNKDYVPIPKTPEPKQMLTVDNSDRTYYPDSSTVKDDEILSKKWSIRKRRKRRIDGTSVATLTDEGEEKDDVMTERRRQEILSYIVRLLHDDAFVDFVDDIERSLAMSPDCAEIFDVLGSSS